MPLPAGFKVNGSATPVDGLLVPPRVKKILAILDKLPFQEVITTLEVSLRLGRSTSGNFMGHPALEAYREKVDNKLFWGSRKSIAQLRKQLATPEATRVKN
jgi:hypothetical protein